VTDEKLVTPLNIIAAVFLESLMADAEYKGKQRGYEHVCTGWAKNGTVFEFR